MFCSNQILVVNGEDKKSLKLAIEFVLNLKEKTIRDIKGITVKDGKLIFGWIPEKEDVDGKNTGKLDYEYEMKWQTALSNQLLPPSYDLIAMIIRNWLDSSEVDKQYKELYEKDEVGYWNTPTRGWKLTAISDETEIQGPVFSIFCIEPAWLEYLD